MEVCHVDVEPKKNDILASLAGTALAASLSFVGVAAASPQATNDARLAAPGPVSSSAPADPNACANGTSGGTYTCITMAGQSVTDSGQPQTQAPATTCAMTCYVFLTQGGNTVAEAIVGVWNTSGYKYIQVCDKAADGNTAYAWFNYDPVGSSTTVPTSRIETRGIASPNCKGPLIMSSSDVTFLTCLS